MAGPQSQMEFVDVLSSIRRLVSEHKRAEEQVGPALADGSPPAAGPVAGAGDRAADDDGQPSRLPRESRLVLTAAHRVGPAQDEGEATLATDPAPFRPHGDGGGAEGLAEDAAPGADGGQDAGADTLVLGTPGTGVVSRAPAGPPGEEGTLEDTIAELEAAVAGIDEEFEADLGDQGVLAEAAGDTSEPDRAPAPPLSGGFQGIMAGFERMVPDEDRLDLPVIGDVAMPILPRGDSWRVNLPERWAESERGAAPAIENAPVAVEGRDAGRETAGPSDAAGDAAPAAGLRGPAATGPEGEPDDEAVLAAGAGPAAVAVAVAAGAEASGADGAADTDDENGPAEVRGEPAAASGAEAVRPRIIRAGQDPGGAAWPEDPPLEGEGGDGADLTGEDLSDDDDLFDPLAALAIDRAALHDIVAEIIREELRGALGERITRNVRLLIRREIERALGAQPDERT